MSESEDRHRHEKYLYTLGALVLEREKHGQAMIGDLDNGLLERFFNAGWDWAKSWKDLALGGPSTTASPRTRDRG